MSVPALFTLRGHRGSVRRLAGVAALAVVGSTLGLTSGVAGPSRPAAAATLPPGLQMFAHCPIANASVTACLFAKTTSTTFQIGSTVVSSHKPTTISLGLAFDANGNAIAVLPDDGTSALQAPAIPLPGGLTGIPGLGGGILQVTVSPQLVGLPTISLPNLITRNGPGITLPVDVSVSNTLINILGADCTIADAATPITLNLTTGTTNPPPPNQPVTGALGTITGRSNGEILISGLVLVDNAFAVPGANGCGPNGILDPILNLDKSLPSAAGSNAATLAGSSDTAPAALIRKFLG